MAKAPGIGFAGEQPSAVVSHQGLMVESVANPPDDYSEWRDWLVRADHQASRDLDRAVMALSSGALALSLVFVKDIVPRPSRTGLLLGAWAVLVVSLLSVLMSFVTSRWSLRGEVARIDSGEEPTAADRWTSTTRHLNYAGVGCLILGVGLLLAFAGSNV